MLHSLKIIGLIVTSNAVLISLKIIGLIVTNNAVLISFFFKELPILKAYNFLKIEKLKDFSHKHL